jgi:hypothetical protein
MYNLIKMARPLAAVALALGVGSAQAALLNFTLTGDVWWSAEANDFVQVVGTFNDDALTGGTGVISFMPGNLYGNTFVVTVGDITFTPDERIGVSDPRLYMTAGSIDLAAGGFTFYATDTDTLVTFNSYFSDFDGDDAFGDLMYYGEWDAGSFTTTVVPVPAAVWLLGSGLLGLVGIARRKARA